MSNNNRIEQIAARGSSVAILELTINPLGRACAVDGVEGRVDAAFIDLEAAVACGIIGPGWFAEQDNLDASAWQERWYSVVLPHGAVLVSARDLALCP